MTIFVDGKGKKDRVVMLSPVLLDTLRQYWRQAKPKHWLFPGETPDQPISGNDIFMVFHNAVRRAGITKKVSPHSLRHSFATNLLESGTHADSGPWFLSCDAPTGSGWCADRYWIEGLAG